MKETYNSGRSFEGEDWQDNELRNVFDKNATLEDDVADGERQDENEIVIGIAEEGDYEAIVKMTDDWAKYFQEKGIRQWGAITYSDGTTKTYAERYPEEYYKGLQEKGIPIVVTKDPNGTVLASLALLSEDKLWPESVPGDSYFIHHFVANREAKHKDGTRRILQTVAESAINNGVDHIRLDCSSDNQILCGI